MVHISDNDVIERCAKIADQAAADARDQIERNNEYMTRTGPSDQSCNDLCRQALHAAETIASEIRSLKSE